MKNYVTQFKKPTPTDGKFDTVDNLATLPLAFSPAWILFLLSASVGVAMIGLGIVWPLVPVYAVELGASGFQVGMIIAAFNVGRTCFNPFAGRLSDRICSGGTYGPGVLMA